MTDGRVGGGVSGLVEGVGVGGLPPGPVGSVLRQVVGYVRDPVGFIEGCHRVYGDVFTVRIQRSGGPFVFFCDPGAIKEVLTGDPLTFLSGEANAVFAALFGPGSVGMMDGPEHLRERRLLLPAFHGERLHGYEELIGEIAEREIARWPTGTVFEVAPRMRALATEVILRAVLGIEDRDGREGLTVALRRALAFLSSPWSMLVLLLADPTGLLLRFAGRHLPLVGEANRLLLDLIARRRSEGDLDGHTDILSMLLGARYEDGSGLSDEHVRDELVTLLIAGYETTATALAWAIERLARHPGIYERLADEDAPDADAFMDATIYETLRLRAPVAFVVRRLARPVTIAGYRLPVGSVLAPCAHLLHRQPGIYPEPEVFRPERFLQKPPGTYTWLAFGGGTRRCLGASFATLEMRTVLRTITRTGTPFPVDRQDERIRRRNVTLVPDRGAKITFAHNQTPHVREKTCV